jgi:hypothetical protein
MSYWNRTSETFMIPNTTVATTTYVVSTNGEPLCKSCWFFNSYQGCSIGKNKSSALHVYSCDAYSFKGEKKR